MNYTSYTDLQNIIKSNLASLQSSNFDLIVGIPRSGMIPAYMIAQYMNKNCCDIDSYLRNTHLQLDSHHKAGFKYPKEAQSILLVDDCISSGGSLSQILKEIPESEISKITTLAIYSSAKKRSDVDIFFEYQPGPHVSEWHIFHCFFVKLSCLNIDGVLCAEPTEEQKGDNVKYIDFILNAEPLYIPSGKIGCIVTDRLERYRSETEAWLKKHRVEYGSLIMFESSLLNDKRQYSNDLAIFKANVYKKSRNELFFERDPEQALKIHDLTNKPVYCLESNEILSKGNIISAIYGSKYSKIALLKNTIANFKKLPKPIYQTLRSVYRLIS